MTNNERIQRRIERDKARRRKKRAAFMEQYDSYTGTFDHENMWTSGHKCCNGVRWKASIQRWESLLLTNVSDDYDSVISGRFLKKSGKFYCFDLYERGHLRHIRSVKVEERCVQKCLCDFSLVPALTHGFIYDNGATMKNKGTSFSEKRLTKHLREYARTYGVDNVLERGYVVLFDFHHYFDNADHAVLFAAVERIYHDAHMVEIIEKFISDFGEKGLGLGSQVSQVLALALADPLDHAIKDRLRMKWYGRYNDDGYVLCRDKAEAVMVMAAIRELAARLNIIVNEKKTHIVKFSRGFQYLKIRYHMTETGRIVRHINHDGIKRQRGRLRTFRKKLNSGTIDLEHVEMSLQAYLSQCDRANTWHTKQNMIRRFHRMFPESRAFYPPPKFGPEDYARAAIFVEHWWKEHENKGWWSRARMVRAYKNLKEVNAI